MVAYGWEERDKCDCGYGVLENDDASSSVGCYLSHIGGSIGTGYLSGSFDDLMIFDKSLSEDEIGAIYGAQKK